MAESTLWWLATGAAVGIELVTGTFYLLMFAIGMAAAALAAHAGAGMTTQLVIGVTPSSGPHRVTELVGSRLLLERIS